MSQGYADPAIGYDAGPLADGPNGRMSISALDDLPPDRRAAVERLDRLATIMDSQFSLFGIRFGADAILSVFPLAGDLAGAAISAYLIFEAAKAGARKRDIGHMAVNVAVETVIGSVPVLGTVFDVFYRANKRNVRILRRTLMA